MNSTAITIILSIVILLTIVGLLSTVVSMFESDEPTVSQNKQQSSDADFILED